MDELIGKMIDRYQILEELGHGGMAVVYKALDTNLTRLVAIKIILPEFTDKEKILKRFYREAKVLAKLSHSNIVKVLDYGEFQGAPYLVMEYLSGGTLRSIMGKPIHFKEATAILVPIARALAYAHHQKNVVIHRDVKPANILINESGQALLSDFGIHKILNTEVSQSLSGTGALIGTPAYMSPEQIRGKNVDNRTDIYALGIVLYEMIVGKKPYNANTPFEVSLMHLNDPIPRARQVIRDLPAEMENIINHALAKNLEDRFHTMDAFADAMEKISGVVNTGSSSIISGMTDSKKGNKKKLLPFLVGGLLMLFISAGVVFFGGKFDIVRLQELIKSPTLIESSLGQDALKMAVTTTSPASSTFTSKPPTSTAIQDLKAITKSPQAAVTVSSVPTETPFISEKVITNDNINKIVELNRVEKVSVINLGWDHDGTNIINIGSSAATLFDAEKLTVINRFPLTEIPLAISVSKLNESFYVLFSKSIVKYSTKGPTNTIPTSGGAYSFAISSDEKLIALGLLDNKVQLRNMETGIVNSSFRSNYGGWCVGFSNDNKYIAGGTSQGGLMWEVDTGTWIPLEGGQNSLIKSVVFSPNTKVIAAGSKNQIFIWDTETGELLFEINEEMGNVNSLDISPNSEFLLSASDDGKLRIWDINSGKLKRMLMGHVSSVFGAYFSPNGERIISGANEGIIRLWGIP